jgi:Tfp pilus assembly protein PilO
VTTLRSQKGMVAAGVVAFVAVLALGWFFAVSPKKDKADELATQVTAAEQELAQKRAELARPSANIRVKADDLYRLQKALPTQVDQAGVILDLDRLAKQHDLTFWQLTPGSPIVGTGPFQQPFDVVLEGRFTNVSAFLRDIRSLVGIKKKRLAVKGRVYSIDKLMLEQPTSDKKFPIVRASLTVNAYSFDSATAAPTDGTTPTTTTSTGTVAAGATP